MIACWRGAEREAAAQRSQYKPALCCLREREPHDIYLRWMCVAKLVDERINRMAAESAGGEDCCFHLVDSNNTI